MIQHRVDYSFFSDQADQIRNICKPLRHIGVEHFTFIRQYSDTSKIYLSSSADWIDAYFAEKLYENSVFEKTYDNYLSGNLIWPIESQLSPFTRGKEILNSHHGITLIERSKDSCDFYFYSANCDFSHMLHLYNDSLSLLKRFNLYFRGQAAGLLLSSKPYSKNLKGTLSTLSDNTQEMQYFKSLLTSLNKSSIKAFILATKFKPIIIVDAETRSPVLITGKETLCALLLLNNHTANEIADILHISRRTVETHLENLKNKFYCQSKQRLIDKLMLTELEFYKDNQSFAL